MKSIKNDEVVKNPSPFPKLMITKIGSIILMTQQGVGVRVFSDNLPVHPLGVYSHEWDGEASDFHGSITLSNGGDDD